MSALGVVLIKLIAETARDGIVLLLYEFDHVRNASVSGNLEY